MNEECVLNSPFLDGLHLDKIRTTMLICNYIHNHYLSMNVTIIKFNYNVFVEFQSAAV